MDVQPVSLVFPISRQFQCKGMQERAVYCCGLFLEEWLMVNSMKIKKKQAKWFKIWVGKC